MLKALKYYGGKLSQLEHILPMIPKHEIFVEPYSGSAAIMLNKPKSKIEVYNDMDSAVVNFFRCLRNKPQELVDYLNLLPYSREEFYTAMEVVSDIDRTDIEKAAYFYLLSEASISCNRAQFSYTRSKPRVSTLYNAINKLMPVAMRIRDWIIENEDAVNIIDRYDSENTFFYIDPPYMWSERGDQRYKHDLDALGHYKLLTRLSSVKGNVLLSGYDNDLYCKHLNGWFKKHYTVYCTAIANTRANNVIGEGSLENHKRTETLWYNYEKELTLF